MRLWGRVVGGSLFLFAAIFLLTGLLSAEARVACLLAAALSAAAGFGAPQLARLFESFTGDEGLLAGGIAARATLTAVEPIGWIYQRRLPIVRFGLQLTTESGARNATLRQVVASEFLARLAPGCTVGVRFDALHPERLVIDWRLPVEGAGS
jgi:hypothetical protein